MKINYDEIQNEYLTTRASVSELARKYGLAKSSLCKRAHDEGWAQMKRQISEEVRRKTIENISDDRTSIAFKCVDILHKLVDKVGESVDIVQSDDIAGLKALATIMKDLRDMGAFEMGESRTNEVVVRFEEEVDELE